MLTEKYDYSEYQYEIDYLKIICDKNNINCQVSFSSNYASISLNNMFNNTRITLFIENSRFEIWINSEVEKITPEKSVTIKKEYKRTFKRRDNKRLSKRLFDTIIEIYKNIEGIK